MTSIEKEALDRWIKVCETAIFRGMQMGYLFEFGRSKEFVKAAFECFPKSDELYKLICEFEPFNGFEFVEKSPNMTFADSDVEKLLSLAQKDLIQKTKAKKFFLDDKLLGLLARLNPVFNPVPENVEEMRFKSEEHSALNEAVQLYLTHSLISQHAKYHELWEVLNAFVNREYDRTWLLMSPLYIHSEIDFSFYKKLTKMAGFYAIMDDELHVSTWLLRSS